MAIYQATIHLCQFIFPYGVNLFSHMVLPIGERMYLCLGMTTRFYSRSNESHLFASVAAWSTVLRRILNLHLGLAGKNILIDQGCLS